MALPTIHAFSVDNLTTLRGTTSVNGLTGSVDNESIELIGYYTDNDGGGGTFYWDSSSTATEVLGMVVRPYIGGSQVATGRWVRLYDGFVDVKWFGCKGDNSTNDTVNLQRALDFVASATPHQVDLYISQGTYIIFPPSPPNNVCLHIDLTIWKDVNIYGDGAAISKIKYNQNGSTANPDIFIIKGTYGAVKTIRDFSIEGIELSSKEKYGHGLVLQNIQTTSIMNINFFWLKKGMVTVDTLTSSFQNVFFTYCKIGVEGQYSSVTPPNLLDFTSCGFSSNDELAVKFDNLYGCHSITFQSCGFEENGTQGNSNTGGIHALFTGINGANGLNINGCYFEGNAGGFDIKLDANGYGSHTFIGNTFNRLSANQYTTHNILIDGNGQPSQPYLGDSKAKLLLEGNGFLATGSYVISPSQRPIELLNISPEYWQYDVVEQGNSYIGYRPAFDSKMPQISELNRVKAFGKFSVTIAGVVSFTDSYNIKSISTVGGPGSVSIEFANPLPSNPVYSVTMVNPFVATYYQTFVDQTKLDLEILDPNTLNPTTTEFMLLVY